MKAPECPFLVDCLSIAQWLVLLGVSSNFVVLPCPINCQGELARQIQGGLKSTPSVRRWARSSQTKSERELLISMSTRSCSGWWSSSLKVESAGLILWWKEKFSEYSVRTVSDLWVSIYVSTLIHNILSTCSLFLWFKPCLRSNGHCRLRTNWWGNKLQAHTDIISKSQHGEKLVLLRPPGSCLASSLWQCIGHGRPIPQVQATPMYESPRNNWKAVDENGELGGQEVVIPSSTKRGRRRRAWWSESSLQRTILRNCTFVFHFHCASLLSHLTVSIRVLSMLFRPNIPHSTDLLSPIATNSLFASVRLLLRLRIPYHRLHKNSFVRPLFVIRLVVWLIPSIWGGWCESNYQNLPDWKKDFTDPADFELGLRLLASSRKIQKSIWRPVHADFPSLFNISNPL